MNCSLIIPCYNEARALSQLLERCKVLIQKADLEVVLVDNGSTDETAEVLRDLLPRYPGCRSIRVEENRGYGFGVLQGLRSAKGDILGWTHADLQTDPLDVLRGLVFFEQYGENIFVKGRRHGRPFLDQAFTFGMSLFETLLLARTMSDINAQPNLFSRKFFESWVAPPEDFSLDLYTYYTAQTWGLKMHRFPVQFEPRLHGTSHWNVNWAGKLKFIRRTIAYSLKLRKSL